MDFIKDLMKKPAVQYLLRLFQNIEEDYIGLLAAGVAFYFFMAAFPALAAMISLYGLFSDPVFISQQLQNLENFLPAESLKILADQAESISSSNDAALGLGFIVGLILAIYATTKGVRALMKGLNIALNVKERRNIVLQNYTAFMLTLGMMIYLLFSLFVSNFGNYNETYGSLGAVAVLLLWFWLNALTILFGAEVNASFKTEEERGRKDIHLAG